MFTGMDKMIAGLLGPFIAKGLTMLTGVLGMAPVSTEVSLGITAIIVGGLVYFIPNKKAA